jgi:hypothetical protein
VGFTDGDGRARWPWLIGGSAIGPDLFYDIICAMLKSAIELFLGRPIPGVLFCVIHVAVLVLCMMSVDNDFSALFVAHVIDFGLCQVRK